MRHSKHLNNALKGEFIFLNRMPETSSQSDSAEQMASNKKEKGDEELVKLQNTPIDKLPYEFWKDKMMELKFKNINKGVTPGYISFQYLGVDASMMIVDSHKVTFMISKSSEGAEDTKLNFIRSDEGFRGWDAYIILSPIINEITVYAGQNILP